MKKRFAAQRREQGANDEGYLLWAMLDVVVDRYFVVTDDVDDRIDAVEEVVLDDAVDRIRRGRPRELFDISKALVRFRRAALPLREVVGAFVRKEVPSIGDPALAHFQDLYDHVLRVSDILETQRDVLTGLRDADLAVTSNQMSLVQQSIAAWGAILLIATLITGVLGMNFTTAPELSWEEGFLRSLGWSRCSASRSTSTSSASNGSDASDTGSDTGSLASGGCGRRSSVSTTGSCRRPRS